MTTGNYIDIIETVAVFFIIAGPWVLSLWLIRANTRSAKMRDQLLRESLARETVQLALFKSMAIETKVLADLDSPMKMAARAPVLRHSQQTMEAVKEMSVAAERKPEMAAMSASKETSDSKKPPGMVFVQGDR